MTRLQCFFRKREWRRKRIVKSGNLFIKFLNKKLWYRRRTARCAMSVKLWSITDVETVCTTNPQQTELMELECYSWSTCSKQPRLVDCRIGVVNKLDRRRRRRRVLLTARSTCRGEIFSKSGVRDKVPERSTLISEDIQISLKQCKIGGRRLHAKNPARFVQSFWYNTGLWRTDRRTDGETTTAYIVLAWRRLVKSIQLKF